MRNKTARSSAGTLRSTCYFLIKLADQSLKPFIPYLKYYQFSFSINLIGYFRILVYFHQFTLYLNHEQS